MSERLSSHVSVVTGASRGIGLAIAKRLLAAGATVVAASRSTIDAHSVAASAEQAERLLPVRCDVRDERDVEQLGAFVADRFGRLDSLINNAGVGHYAPLEELSIADWDEMIDVNLRGTFLCCRTFIPMFKRQRRGHIVNISSVAGTTTFVNGGGYCASKWGVMALADVMRQELRPYEIKVTTVCPGSVQTDFAGTPPKPYALRPDDVASAVMTALTSPPGVIYGTIIMRPLVPREYQS